MSRTHHLASLVLLAALVAPTARAQPAATDEGARRLIDQLCPPGASCRGIRMPGTDSGTPSPAAPQLVPGTEAVAPGPGAAPLPDTTAALPTPPPPRRTTAPTGVAAVSITVNFGTGSASLTPQAAAALGSLGRALASPELAPYRFRIEGHTDTVGDDRQNLLLSQRRAEAVRAYLTKRFGVAPARLDAVGLGESQPLVPTADQTPEPGNRRVQVLNLGG